MFSPTEYCNILENLALDYISGVTNDGLLALQQFAALRTLRLSGCSINDSSLAIVAGCIKLQVLYLVDCELVSDTGLQNLLGIWEKDASIGCRQLEYLNVAHCPNISPSGLEYFLEHSPTLRELDIKHDSALMKILSRLRTSWPLLTIYASQTT